MEEWKAYKLSDIADIQTGPFGSQLHNNDYVEKGTPIVTVEHLGSRKFSTQNLPCVSDDDKSRLSKYTLKEGDIVFSRVGSVDRCSYVSHSEDGWMFSGRCLRVRCTNLCNPLFLYYYFCKESVKQYIRSIAVGATMPSINTKLLSEVSILLPSLKIQNKIADTLSIIDDKIELNKQINDNLEQQAQALYKSWFIDFEPFKDGKFVDSEFGLIPAGWKTGSISDIAKISSGKRPAKKCDKKNNVHNIPVYGASGIMAYTNDVLYDSPLLLIGRVGTLGVTQRVNRKSWPSDNTLTIFTQYYNYIYFILKGIDYSAINRGSTQPLITQTDINQEGIVIPSLDILEQFENQCNSLYKMIAMHKDENIILETIRDTLLPKLMSGELKINETDC